MCRKSSYNETYDKRVWPAESWKRKNAPYQRNYPGSNGTDRMETSEIIQGIVAETKPDIVIAIDALAARSTRRLNRTIQITEHRNQPGFRCRQSQSGAYRRKSAGKSDWDRSTHLVDAATIVHDSMAHLLEALEEAEQKEFLEEMISPHLHTMFVTPKDVDETVKYLSFTISEGLNMAFEEIGG